ncbi:MAG: N-acetyl-gamma-glutamyl-phosphate reductase [Acidobacteriota bacterium]
MSRTPIGIAGFSGYSGAELIQILSRHPHAEPILLEHREAQEPPRPIGYAGPRRMPCNAESIRSAGIKGVLLATAPEISMELAPAFLDAGAKVVDLSGAFRLGTTANFQRWYKEDHTQPGLLAEAVYSIPEFHRHRVPGARLISNPGCYPTAANLALKPLLDAGAIDRSAGIVCDAKSGVSGAGRKATLKTHFCEVTDNFSVYSIMDHRHVPEVLGTSGLEEREFTFTAHLLPIDRGILETIYFRASEHIHSAQHIVDIYLQAYHDEPFVRVYPPGGIPELRVVARTNFCDLAVKYDANTRRVVVVSLIDNLVKGAAGQAMQNLNLALGWTETAGLL